MTLSRTSPALPLPPSPVFEEECRYLQATHHLTLPQAAALLDDLIGRLNTVRLRALRIEIVAAQQEKR